MKPVPSLPALNRRSFLCLSSIAALATVGAATPATASLAPPYPAYRAGSAKPDLHGRWFAV